MNQNKSFNLSSLNIQASALACPMDGWLYSYGIKYLGGNVVLTERSTSFDAGTIARLVASINQDNPSILPNGFTTFLADYVDSTDNYGSSCSQDLEVTNTSQDIVQITRIALLYTANPQPNTYHYNFIDICSLPVIQSRDICHGGRGGNASIQIYSFQLIPGGAGTIVSSQETQLLSIDPGATVVVELQTKPANISNPNYIYSIVPQLTLSTSAHPLELSQLTSRAVFIDKNLASCYQLQSDDTFLQVKNPQYPSSVTQGVPDGQGNMIFPDCI